MDWTASCKYAQHQPARDVRNRRNDRLCTGNNALPASVRQDIIERTDGIPLFVEEMTKAVLEVGEQNAAEQMVEAIPSSLAAVPPSLHASRWRGWIGSLWRDQSKVQQARELLAPVYGWFIEGFDTRDLKEAKALLGELAA